MATPDQVKFSTSAVEGTQATAELMIYRSELPSYNPAQNKFIRLNLPVSSKGWIDFGDTVLSMQITNRSYDTAVASAGDTVTTIQMNDVIQSISILNSQGEQIEHVSNYNLISNIMDDYTVSQNHKSSIAHVLSGGASDGAVTGAPTLNGSSATTEADGESITLVDRIMTGFTSGQFLLPLGYSIGAATALVIELSDPNTALTLAQTANTVAAYAVSNVELRAKEIKFNAMFNASFEETLRESGAQGVNYISETFLHSQGSVPTSTTGPYNIPFSVNPRSAKYMFVCHRLTENVAGNVGKIKQSLSQRDSMNISEYTFEIAGKQLPSQPIKVSSTNISQSYAQVLDCLGQIGNIGMSNLVSRATTLSLFYAAAETPCKYLSGIPLEDFNSASNVSIYSGMNLTSAGTLNYRPTFTSTDNAYTVDIFSSIDISFHFTADGRIYSVK